MAKHFKNSKLYIKSHDGVMMTSHHFSSITHAGLTIYEISTQSDIPFYRYRALKYATL